MTSSTRRPVALLALVVLAACSADTESADHGAQSTASAVVPSTTDQALVELPVPPATAPAPAPTTGSTTVPGTTVAPGDVNAVEPQLVGVGAIQSLDQPVALTFDWGSSSCRVSVEMITEVEDSRRAATTIKSATSVVSLAALDDDWRYSRNVTGAQQLSPPLPSDGQAVLDTMNEFIPVMRLDDRGRLLDAEPSVEDAQEFVSGNIEQIAISELGRTMLAWVWVWADLESVGQDARRENVSEPLGEVEITSWSLGRYPDGTIHAFVVRESIGPDAGSPGAADDGLAVRLVVEAVIDPASLQPDQVRAEQLSSREGDVVARELVSTEFDWENAEGCE